MILLDEFDLSEWAYIECLKGNDTQQIRSLITYSGYVYNYCRYIKDRDDMWIKIKNRIWVKAYCTDIKDRPELRKKIDRIK